MDVVCMRVYVCGRLRETIDKYVTVGRKRARPGYGIGIRTAVLRLCVWEPDVNVDGMDRWWRCRTGERREKKMK